MGRRRRRWRRGAPPAPAMEYHPVPGLIAGAICPARGSARQGVRPRLRAGPQSSPPAAPAPGLHPFEHTELVIDLKQILCLAADPWSRTNPSRTQRLLSGFPDIELLYFEPEAPRASARQRNSGRAAHLTRVYTLPPIPAVNEYHPAFSPHAHRHLLRAIRTAMEESRVFEPLLWVASPIYDELLDEIPHAGLIYDCDRDWSALPPALESRLTCRADLVFAASAGLREHLSPCSRNIIVVPFGIDFPQYDARVTDGFLCPPDLARCPFPRFGYAGTIWPNLNLTPVEAAAEAHPEWSFVFLGRISRKNPYVDALRRLPNVYFLGQKREEAVPAYLRHLTAGMMLLRDGMEDDDVLSPRVYEYFAQGLPVAAMYYHLQKESYPTLIDSAYSVPRFVEMCEKIAAGDPVEKKISRYEIASGADWSMRCAQVREAVADCRLLDRMDLTRSVDEGRDWFA